MVLVSILSFLFATPSAAGGAYGCSAAPEGHFPARHGVADGPDLILTAFHVFQDYKIVEDLDQLHPAGSPSVQDIVPYPDVIPGGEIGRGSCRNQLILTGLPAGSRAMKIAPVLDLLDGEGAGVRLSPVSCLWFSAKRPDDAVQRGQDGFGAHEGQSTDASSSLARIARGVTRSGLDTRSPGSPSRDATALLPAVEREFAQGQGADGLVVIGRGLPPGLRRISAADARIPKAGSRSRGISASRVSGVFMLRRAFLAFRQVSNSGERRSAKSSGRVVGVDFGGSSAFAGRGASSAGVAA